MHVWGLLGLVPQQLKVVVHSFEESLAQFVVLHELVHSNHALNEGYPLESEGVSRSQSGVEELNTCRPEGIVHGDSKTDVVCYHGN